MALELFLYEPSHDTYSAYWSVHTMSVELKREARMSSHRFSTEDVKHAALWRENYILLFFFKYYSTYIYI